MPELQSRPQDIIVDEEDSYDQWTHVADALCKHYKDHEKAIHEELDGFLSFSGIFSAVVTLFVGQSVTWLQPDNSQVSVDILRTISKQIANQTTTPIADSDVQPSNTPSRSFTVTDMLSMCFFISLTGTLIASCMSLYVRQWLREYLLDQPSSSYDRALLQLYRHRALQRWKIDEIGPLISLILQGSVTWFSCGVVMVAYKLNFIPLTIILSLLLCAFLAPSLLSTLIRQSKTPFPVFVLSGALYFLHESLIRSLSILGLARGRSRSLEMERTLEDMGKHRGTLELEALTFANLELESKRLKSINKLFKKASDKDQAVDCIKRILCAHYDRELDGSGAGLAFEPLAERVLSRTHDEGIKHLVEIGRQIIEEAHQQSRRGRH